MNQQLLNAVSELEERDYNFPSVSIIMPFEPKMKSKRELISALQAAVERVEKEIFDKFSAEMALLVLQKLKAIIKDLDFTTYKKSVAVYVSPVFEKVLYLNMDVRERVLVNGFFHIRDLVKSKRHSHQHLLAQIGDNECRIYVNESGKMEKIFSHKLENISGCSDSFAADPEIHFDTKMENCQIEKFLRRIDNTLHFILDSFHLPLFVVGPEKRLEQFIKVTNHSPSIVEYVPCEHEHSSEEEIRKLMVPYITDWRKLKEKFILSQLQTAGTEKKLASGITNVYKIAMHRNGRLLLVGENYEYPTAFAVGEETRYKDRPQYNRFSYIKDAVDDIIEKVLDEGGDVEFVSEKIMSGYNHIALIL